MSHVEDQDKVAPGADGEFAAIDQDINVLSAAKKRWANFELAARIEILDELLRDFLPLAEPWTKACCEAKGLDPASPAANEEWLGFAALLRAIKTLRNSLSEIAREGRPRIPGPIRSCGENQTSVQVFPQSVHDRVLFPKLTAEIWMQPRATEETVRQEQAAVYRTEDREGKVALVLGAGNFSLLGPCDVLYKMFCENQVVVMKCHPVTAYLAPLLRKGFRGLIERDFLRIVEGKTDKGQYLVAHEVIDELHLTGSDRTYDAIVFGSGDEGVRRKAADQPQVTKRFTCELGNLSPVIVVPGPWTSSDIAYQAEHLASMQILNAGFNCLTTRLIVQHSDWPQRDELLDAIRRVFKTVPTRDAYYPGAHEIHDSFLAAHPEAEQFGDRDEKKLPWTLIAGVDPSNEDDVCFHKEAFCSLYAETGLAADDVPQYIDKAVDFVNEKVWGTLTATLLVHPQSLKDPAIAEAVERAVANLRYGTVGVNAWGLLNYSTLAGSWGAYPGHPPTDIQSGHGTVHNLLMIPRPQKTVLRAPFRQSPKPICFPSHKTALTVARKLVGLQASPSLLKLASVVFSSLRA